MNNRRKKKKKKRLREMTSFFASISSRSEDAADRSRFTGFYLDLTLDPAVRFAAACPDLPPRAPLWSWGGGWILYSSALLPA